MRVWRGGTRGRVPSASLMSRHHPHSGYIDQDKKGRVSEGGAAVPEHVNTACAPQDTENR